MYNESSVWYSSTDERSNDERTTVGLPDLSMFENKPPTKMRVVFRVPNLEYDVSEFSPGHQAIRDEDHIIVTEEGEHFAGNIVFPGLEYELEIDGDLLENPHFVSLQVIR